MAEKKLRPPYTSAADLDRLFERMRTIGDPGTVSTKWVESYGLAASQPEGVVAALKWLNVIDKDGKSQGIWNDLRVPATRQETLTRLMHEAYEAIFSSIDVEQASRQDLEGAFISAYQSGDPGRPIKCFLALCQHAGIATAATQRGTSSRAAKPADSAKSKSQNGTSKQATGARTTPVTTRVKRRPSQGGESHVTIALNVEIPADWSEDQVRERVEMIRRAVEGP